MYTQTSLLLLLICSALVSSQIETRPGKCHHSCSMCDQRLGKRSCLVCKDSNAKLDPNTGLCVCRKHNQTVGENGFCRNCHFSCQNCSSPYNSSACTQCYPNATLVDGTCTCSDGLGLTHSGQCENCSVSCKTCALANNPTFCTSCVDPAATITSARIFCPMIFPPPPECQQYQNKTGACVCPAGYAMGDDGYCAACDPTCQNCSEPNNSTKCTGCKTGAVLSENGTCNCSANSTAVMDPYGNCGNATKICDPTCASCLAGGNPVVCQSCIDPNATLVEPYPAAGFGACLCPNATYFNTTILSCIPCPGNCSACDDYGVCQTCLDGYYFDIYQQLCIACSDTLGDCLSCDNSTNCTNCGAGSVLINGTCTTLEAGCTPGSVDCPPCQTGYYNDTQTNTCKKCSIACLDCEGAATNCTSCDSGYALDTYGYCRECPLGCATCQYNSDGEFVCLDCNYGFVKNGSYCSSCKQAFMFCQVCTLDSCLSCPKGFYMLSSTACDSCGAVLEGCQECNVSSVCLACKPPYKLNATSGLCQCPVIGCKDCSIVGGGCRACQPKYYRPNSASQTCFQCHPTCASCDQAGINMCTSCPANALLTSPDVQNRGRCECTAGFSFNAKTQSCVVQKA